MLAVTDENNIALLDAGFFCRASRYDRVVAGNIFSYDHCSIVFGKIEFFLKLLIKNNIPYSKERAADAALTSLGLDPRRDDGDSEA